jgi:hypothetical protein
MTSNPLVGSYFTSDPWIWVAAFFTLAIYSFLYRDNVVYKITENIFIGVAAGYLVVVEYFNVVVPDLIDPLVKDHKLLVIIPGILMILMFTRIIPSISWLSRIPIAFMVGVGAGLAIPTTMNAMVMAQVKGTLMIDFLGGPYGPVLGAIGGGIMLVGTICTLVYFFFSKPHEGATGYVAKVGIMILMIGFGASFGYTVMARISLLIGRVLFLLRDWMMVIS